VNRSFGPYLLEEELGSGGMGVVFAARHAQSGARVALKILSVTEPDVLARLEREARVAERLDHPGAVAPRATGVLEGRPFAVMELVPGETLAALLDRGALDRGRALALVREVALVLAHAHERGVVHRDLKPANVMVDAQGRARVLDFGLALASGERNLTETGVVVGTPAFLSPEQARGDRTPIGPAADVYAIGVMLYRVLAGRHPFQGDAIALLRKVLLERPVPPRTLDPTIPRALDDLVLRCLEKDPARRPRAVEVARELDRIARSKVERPRAPLLAGVVLASLAFAGAAVAWSFRARPQPTPPPPFVAPPAPEVRPPRAVEVTEERKREALELAVEAAQVQSTHDDRRTADLVARALAADPRQPLAHAIKGYLVFSSGGALEDAEREVQTAIELDPRVSFAHFYLAHLRRIQHRLEEAVSETGLAIELEPQNARFRVLRGEYEVDLRRIEPAKEDFRIAKALNPNGWGVTHLEGLLAFDAGRLDDAYALFTKEVEVLNRHSADGWNLRARVEIARGHPVAAVSDALQSLELDPTNPQFHFIASQAYEASGDFEKAMEMALEGRKLGRGDPEWDRHLDDLENRIRARGGR
jgi:serine/threonine-protein kinase